MQNGIVFGNSFLGRKNRDCARRPIVCGRLSGPGRTQAHRVDTDSPGPQSRRPVGSPSTAGRHREAPGQGRPGAGGCGPMDFPLRAGGGGSHGPPHLRSRALWRPLDRHGEKDPHGDNGSECGTALCTGPLFPWGLRCGTRRMGVEFQVQSSGRHPRRSPR